LAESKPWGGLGMSGQEGKVILRAELEADVFGIGRFLDGGIHPLFVVLEERFAGDELGLLRIPHDTCLSIVSQARGRNRSRA